MADRVLRTLIVEDYPPAVERLQIACARVRMLQRVGVATDGEAALRLIAALQPDPVFLDIAMPGMTGIDVARTLEQRLDVAQFQPMHRSFIVRPDRIGGRRMTGRATGLPTLRAARRCASGRRFGPACAPASGAAEQAMRRKGGGDDCEAMTAPDL